ncbi:MAG: ABC transporter ATP-binding protein [Clostridia bacterium]|nr:ABC transporter ATP-binding protein [Clostridia bacterium]
MAAIQITDLKKVYPGAKAPAVENFNLTIDGGELIVLLGPTGAGKTAVLRMLCGLDDVTEGEVSLNGQIINDYLPKDREMAVVFKSIGLYPHLNVYDNLAFGLKMRKIPKAEIDKSVYYVAKLLGIDQLLNKRPKLLSAAERARVSFGRAIVRKTNLILMDDPLAGFDDRLKTTLRNDVLKICQRLSVNIVYATRDAVEALTLADRIVFMEDGKVLQTGTPEDIYLDPATVSIALYVGSPKINLIEGRVTDDKKFIVGDNAINAEKPACKRCYLAVRAENIRLADAGFKATVKSVEKAAEDKYIVSINFAGDNKTYAMLSDAPVDGEITVGFEKYKFFDAATELPL